MVFVSRRAPGQSPDGADELPTRLGITVTRKVGNAVTRNRIKRLVREVFRVHRLRLPQGLDMVWVAKQQAAAATYAEVARDFEALVARRAQLVEATRTQARGRRRRSEPKQKPKR
ncbi:Ribonuclease P protein component [Enhygromyxa salina]|uniref:Ribonuclease P protein component n=2 Tax=Enhygromyxa salina TaxID=215803 RepID=A0A2S9XRF1_9BACT|nr:Ribonuclease P protein component [Enhygromyxa salina]